MAGPDAMAGTGLEGWSEAWLAWHARWAKLLAKKFGSECARAAAALGCSKCGEAWGLRVVELLCSLHRISTIFLPC